jgi:glycerate kinase
MARGLQSLGFGAVQHPVADGGDGTLDVLVRAAGAEGRISRHHVAGPLGHRVTARLGWVAPRSAVVELAEAAGLRRLRGRADPLASTSYGAGELIAAALDAGARRLIVGVGGSASNDGGAGILQALGALLLDASGEELERGGGALTRVEHIDLSGVREDLSACRVDVATDVRSPLVGPHGAARVFGPQKGATPSEVEVLDSALARFATVAERDLGAVGVADLPGAGAAGGCGFGLALLGARLLPGAALVCDRTHLDAGLGGAAAVLTGEGRLDSQTAAGKAPSEVARRARGAGIPCVAIAGVVDDPLGGVFDAVYSLTDLAAGRDPRRHADELLARAASQAMRDLQSAGRLR